MTPEEKREYVKQWRKNNPDKVKGYRDNYNNSESGKQYKRNWEKDNLSKIRPRQRELNKEWRLRAIVLLGGKCECCSESTYEFLCIDHINGGGGQERKMITSQQLYRKIAQEAVNTTEYRVLCANCNQATAFHSICPHQNAEA